MKLEFKKYHGAGNDFIIIDNRSSFFMGNKELVKFLCDRHFGIGADGLMLLENHPKKDFLMRYFNADGGEATLCGNGGRCIVAFAHCLGIINESTEFMAMDGVHKANVKKHEDYFYVELQMNDVDLEGINSNFDFLNTGSPHHISWVDDVEQTEVFVEGKSIRYSDRYTSIGGANVNFVEPISKNRIKIRTYERGVEDETLACGTGSTAAAILYALKNNFTESIIEVEAIGGELQVKFEKNGNRVQNIFLSGPAKEVFCGRIEI